MEFLESSSEIYLSERNSLFIKRNDFEDLGSIVQIEGIIDDFKDYIMSLMFYDHNKVNLPTNKLILLTNQKYCFFENQLILNICPKNQQTLEKLNLYKSEFSELEDKIFTLKFLNKEIFYFKILLIKKNPVTNFNCEKNKIINHNTQINPHKNSNVENKGFSVYNVDCFNMSLIECSQDFKNEDKFDLKNEIIHSDSKKNIIYSSNLYQNNMSKTEKKDQINLILEELNNVNSTLITEKESLEKQKREIKIREENINTLIINFKKEIFSYSDKLIAEAGFKFNNKVVEISKKISNTELNLANKFKIIKEKYGIGTNKNKFDNKQSNNKVIDNNREKIANLEIRIKQYEENLSSMRTKISEKDESLKNMQENEEKFNKSIKKLKDEIITNNIKIKELNEKLNKYDALLKITDEKDDTKNLEKNSNFVFKNLQENTNIIPISVPIKKNFSNINAAKNKSIKKFVTKKFELTKDLMDQYIQNELLNDIIDFDFGNNYNLLLNKIISFSNKEYYTLANILIGFFVNPINLYKDFPLSLMVLTKKFCLMIIKMNYKEISISCESINLQANVGNKNLDNELFNFKEIFSEIANNYQDIIKFITDSIKNNSNEEVVDLQSSNFNSNLTSNNLTCNNNLFDITSLINVDYKIKSEKKELLSNNIMDITKENANSENSSNNSLAQNYCESITNMNYEVVSLNYILLKKIQYFLSNHFDKKEKIFIEKKNYLFYKISKVSLYLMDIFLNNNSSHILNTINKIHENFILTKDNFMINFILKNYFLEQILIIIKNINSKRFEIIKSFCKIFIEIFLFLYCNDYLILNSENDYYLYFITNNTNSYGFNYKNNNSTINTSSININFNKILKILLIENENMVCFIRHYIKNFIINLNYESIHNDNLNDFNRKFIMFLSILKAKLPNEIIFLLTKDYENLADSIRENLINRNQNLNNSVYDEINDSYQNIMSLIEENVLNIIN